MLKKALSIFMMTMLWSSASYAHYPMLIMDRSPITVKLKDTVNLSYGRGHLYKREWSEAPKPDWVKAVNFDGMTKDISSNLKQDGERYQLTWQVERPGDSWLVVHNPLVWSEHDNCWVETTLRSVVHVGFSKGWQEPLGISKVEMLPLTCPYGLLPGDTMRLQVLKAGKALPSNMVYAERYYEKPLDNNEPPLELLMRSAQTDPNGVAALTLGKAGWWVIFTVIEDGEQKVGDKEGIIQREDAVWVYVEEGL